MDINKITNFVQDIFKTKNFIPLHEPSFADNEKHKVLDVIESTFVSSIGEYVNEFEKELENYTKANKIISVVNGTAAIHAALYASSVGSNDLVITQSLTFVATCNAIFHTGAEPVFVDISDKTLGLCPLSLSNYLEENAEIRDSGCFHVSSSKRIKAVIVMHTFGHPAQLDEICEICNKWNITLIEDAAESLGSFYKNKHTGTYGDYGTLSFNGNKIITTGGGGAIMCKDIESANYLKHITTTAKVPHDYEFFHDEPGFNYRLPNINAALGVAQLEKLNSFVNKKRELAKIYENFFKDSNYKFFKEPADVKSNYWLNAIICSNKKERNRVLKETNKAGVMTRPAWNLMHTLPMYKNCMRGNLDKSFYFAERLVNIPSSSNWDYSK